jgi:hypothetical protein
MSRMSEAYGGRLAKALDLDRRGHLTTVKSAIWEKLPDFNNPTQQNDRLVLSFSDFAKDVAVNATSARVLMAAFGEDERAYIGKKIVLYPMPVNVGGVIKESVMIRLPKQSAAPPPLPPVDPTTTGDFDDDIPF